MYVNASSSSEESGVVCLKVECAVNDIACLTNLTKSVQWQYVSVPSVNSVTSPLIVVDIQTARPVTGRPTIADLYPTSFDIIAGNDDQLFDVVDWTPVRDADDESAGRPPDSASADEKRGSIRLLRPVRGPSQHVLTLQMEVRSRQGVVMSRHIAHVTVHVGAYRF